MAYTSDEEPTFWQKLNKFAGSLIPDPKRNEEIQARFSPGEETPNLLRQLGLEEKTFTQRVGSFFHNINELGRKLPDANAQSFRNDILNESGANDTHAAHIRNASFSERIASSPLGRLAARLGENIQHAVQPQLNAMSVAAPSSMVQVVDVAQLQKQQLGNTMNWDKGMQLVNPDSGIRMPCVATKLGQFDTATLQFAQQQLELKGIKSFINRIDDPMASPSTFGKEFLAIPAAQPQQWGILTNATSVLTAAAKNPATAPMDLTRELDRINVSIRANWEPGVVALPNAKSGEVETGLATKPGALDRGALIQARKDLKDAGVQSSIETSPEGKFFLAVPVRPEHAEAAQGIVFAALDNAGQAPAAKATAAPRLSTRSATA